MYGIVRASLIAGLALCVGCPEPDTTQTVRRQFNGDDVVQVEITAKGPPGPAKEIVLTSSTGATDVGTVTIEPGSGPVGTKHTITVDVGAQWADRIEIAEIIADAGDRGERIIPLEPDSADRRLWVEVLESVGLEGEVRTDTFTFELYELVEETIVP